MRHLLCVLVALPCFVTAQTPPADSPQPIIRSTTSEVLLDFVARDRHANIIRDLRPEEVQIFEDGIPQNQRYFQFIDGHAIVPPSVQPQGITAQPPRNSPADPLPVNEVREMSVVSVVIGNLDPRGRELTLKAMRDFAKTDLGPNTYVGVFTLSMGGLRVAQNYTNDATEVSAGVEKAVTNVLAGSFIPVGIGGGFSLPSATISPYVRTASKQFSKFAATAWVNEMHDVYMGSMQYLSPLRSLVDAQAQIPGRKVMLLFSAGILVHTDTVELLRSIISAANRVNVSIYAVDTRGLTVNSTLGDSRRRLEAAANASMNAQMAKVSGGDQEVTVDEVMAPEIAATSIHSDTRANMKELAEGTGGALLPDTLNLREPIREAIENSRIHYEVTYAPANPSLDGNFRKIVVKVTRPGVKVFARSGYYAVPLVNGRQVYPFEVATLKAIDTKPDLHQFDLHVKTLEFRPGAARTQYAFVFQAQTKDLNVMTDEKWAKVHVCVTALIRDSGGEVVDKISKDIPYEVPLAKKAELERGTVSFTAPFFLPPGHYFIDAAAVDRQSMKASVNRSTLDVEQSSDFAMSDVTLVRRIDQIRGTANAYDPLESRGGKVLPDLTDIVTPDQAGNIKFYAVAYPPASMVAPVAMTIEIWRDGQPIMRSAESQVSPDASGAASVLASLPAAKLQPGNYKARVSFQCSGQKLTNETTFIVAGGV